MSPQKTTRRVKVGRRTVSSPRVRLGRGTRAARETQNDITKLLAAAAAIHFNFIRSVTTEIEERAAEAFRAGNANLLGSASIVPPSRFAGQLGELLAAALVLGVARVRSEAGLAMRKTEPEFAEILGTVAPNEAIAFLRGLPVVTREQFDALLREGNRRAFTVAGNLTQAQVRVIRSLLTGSLERGESQEQFRRRVRLTLDQAQVSMKTLSVVWSNNIGQAMHDGREVALDDPEVARLLSFGYFDAQNDFATRPNHRALDHAVARTTWWRAHRLLLPFLGHRCRCAVIWITAGDARRRLETPGFWNIEEQGIPLGAGPDAGFK